MTRLASSMAASDIHLGEYWMPADAATWPDRMEAGCRVLEERLGLPLSHAHGGTKRHATIKKIADRPKLFRQRLRTQLRWCVVTSEPHPGGEEHSAELVSLGGKMDYGGEVYRAGLVIEPELPFATHEKVLAELGDALGAHFCAFLPRRTEMRLRLAHHCGKLGTHVHCHELTDRTPEEAALPLIADSYDSGVQPLQPRELGWINYWSQEVCEHVGFPANLEGTPYLSDCYRTPGGGWIVKFGDAPFEPKNAHHLELLRAMYERFPRVGIRLSTRPDRPSTR